MGPELFDKAFKTYAERWAFKHPKPADFFRTMEDASAMDLDWFWKGWFYSVRTGSLLFWRAAFAARIDPLPRIREHFVPNEFDNLSWREQVKIMMMRPLSKKWGHSKNIRTPNSSTRVWA